MYVMHVSSVILTISVCYLFKNDKHSSNYRIWGRHRTFEDSPRTFQWGWKAKMIPIVSCYFFFSPSSHLPCLLCAQAVARAGHPLPLHTHSFKNASITEEHPWWGRRNDWRCSSQPRRSSLCDDVGSVHRALLLPTAAGSSSYRKTLVWWLWVWAQLAVSSTKHHFTWKNN